MQSGYKVVKNLIRKSVHLSSSSNQSGDRKWLFCRNMAEEQQQEIPQKEADGEKYFTAISQNQILFTSFCSCRWYFELYGAKAWTASDLLTC